MGNKNSASFPEGPSHALSAPGEPTHNRNLGSFRSSSLYNDDSGEIHLESGNATDLAKAIEASEEGLEGISDEEKEPDVADTIEDKKGLESKPPTSGRNASIKLRVYSSSDVKIESVIGEGEFGKVSKGILQGRQRLPVAVRVFNAPFDCKHSVGQLNTIMKLKHRNVVAVLGILDSSTASAYGPKVLLHYFPEGNLLQYFSPRSDNPRDSAMMVKLALDIIQGCEYLHSKRVIHGNLAARNILIEKQRGKVLTHYNAKVSDHGIIQLTKAKGTGKNYMRVHNGVVLPIRWVPKELLEEGSKGFTYASDVWSFGIVLWEMLTMGSVPYGRKKEESQVIELIQDGLSPLNIRVPEGSPDKVTEVMKRIFKVNPRDRPAFYELRREFITISGTVKSRDTGNKSRQDSITAKENPGDKDHGRRPTRDESRSRDTESFGRRRPRGCKSSSGGRVFTSRQASEKVNLLKSSEERPNLQNEAPKTTGSKEGRTSFYNQNMDQNTLQMPPGGGHGYSHQRHGRNERGADAFMTPPAFHTIPPGPSPFAPPINPMSMPPPPPYTPKPLPNHSAFGVSRGRGRGPPRRSQPERSEDFAKEIEKKEQELEQLKVQKICSEVTEKWDQMQALVSQLADLKAGAAALPPPSRKESGDERRHQPDNDYERSRRQSRGGGGGGGGRGQGRSRSRRGEAPKLAPASTPKYNTHENVF